jgi:hypothetical protein
MLPDLIKRSQAQINQYYLPIALPKERLPARNNIGRLEKASSMTNLLYGFSAQFSL